jgi:hypothetical protein
MKREVEVFNNILLSNINYEGFTVGGCKIYHFMQNIYFHIKFSAAKISNKTRLLLFNYFNQNGFG